MYIYVYIFTCIYMYIYTHTQAMLMGARAAEAVREGWLPDSIHRTDEELAEMILDLRRRNQEERTDQLQVPKETY